MTITADDLDDDLADDDTRELEPVQPHGDHRRLTKPVTFRPRRRPRTTPKPENYYPHVFEFVTDFLAPTYAHEVNSQIRTFRWCPEWFRHPEAMVRLEAAWKAWEVLRLDPGTGASTWLREHGDPCMAMLTGPEGPFAGCSTKHRQPHDLPTAMIPVALYGAEPFE